MSYVSTIRRGLGALPQGYYISGLCANGPGYQLVFPDGSAQCLSDAAISAYGTAANVNGVPPILAPSSAVPVQPAGSTAPIGQSNLTIGPSIPPDLLSGGIQTYFDSALAWVKANPLLAAAGAVGIFLVVKR